MGHFLIKELHENIRLIQDIGAGYGLIERALSPVSVRSKIEENEREAGAMAIRSLAVRALARYMLIVEINPLYFDYAASNHLPRALFNNHIGGDDNLEWWAWRHRGAFCDDAMRAARPLPDDLANEIEGLRVRLRSVVQD